MDSIQEVDQGVFLQLLSAEGQGKEGKAGLGRETSEFPLSRQAGLKLQWSRGACPAVLTLVSYGSRLFLVGTS